MESKTISQLASEYAIENYKNGLNCAESVYNALLRAGALRDVAPETVAMVIGFGGGVGLSGSICGALAASVVANGAKYGRPDPYAVPTEVRGSEIAKKYYARYNNLICDFAEANGSPLCKEICGKYEDFHSKERKVGCLRMIGATAELACRYLEMTPEEAAKLPYRERVGEKK